MDSVLRENLSNAEMRDLAARLATELESAKATIANAARQIADLESQRDALEHERDGLKVHLERLSPASSHVGKRPELLTAPAGHFYSPIVDPASPFVRKALKSGSPPAA